MHFKANQTAAAYVARELNERAQEAFEIHMMSCADCVNDVESWRVIKTHMPEAAVVETARRHRKLWWGGWGMAASFLGTLLVGGLGGWYASVLERPSLDSGETAIFNMPALTRSLACTTLPVAANARSVVLRVPGVDSQRHVLAMNSSGHELTNGRYKAHQQRDGSWVVQLDSDFLQQEPAHIVTRGAYGEDESLGCVTATVAPPPAG